MAWSRARSRARPLDPSCDKDELVEFSLDCSNNYAGIDDSHSGRLGKWGRYQ
jgi:hypothetical protein